VVLEPGPSFVCGKLSLGLVRGTIEAGICGAEVAQFQNELMGPIWGKDGYLSDVQFIDKTILIKSAGDEAVGAARALSIGGWRVSDDES
jgi:hypothetical protein